MIYIYISPCSVHLLFNMLTVIYYISQRAFQIDSNYCAFRTFFTNVCFECILTIMYILNVILLTCIYSSANVYSVHILINNQCALLDICSPFTYITHLFFYKQSSIYDLQFNANIVTFSNIFVRSFHIFMYRLHVILRYELQKKISKWLIAISVCSEVILFISEIKAERSHSNGDELKFSVLS